MDRLTLADALEKGIGDPDSTPDMVGEYVRMHLSTILSALRDAGTGRDSGEAEDDRFSRELHAAYDRNDADGYARILSGRLRQMDKRARAANVRADQLEAKLRLMRVRADGAQTTGRERAADLCDARAEYFESAPGYREWTDAARSYRATAKEIRSLQTGSYGHE